MSTARVLAERYTVIRSVGSGPGADGYIARDIEGGSLRALRFVRARPSLTPDEVDRFVAEAKGTFEHPSVQPILDAGYDPDSHSLYLVTEALHGETLRELLADRARVDLDRRLDILERVLDPLGDAHRRGVVHGDLTPANVFEVRSRRGVEGVTLLEMGLAEVIERYAAPDVRFYSSRFEAPERHGGDTAGPASDVWSFGVMLYEALTGKKPFDALSRTSMVQAICHAPHRPVDMIRQDIDASLARLVDACLEKDPGRRPSDGRTLMRLFTSMRGSALSRSGALPVETILDRSGGAPPAAADELEIALRRNPRDPQVHRALLAFYDDEAVPDGVWLAAAALDFLGAATREEQRLHHHHRRAPAIEHDVGLDASGWAALLHADQDPRLDAVCAEITPGLAALHRRSDDDLELGNATRVDLSRSDDPLAAAFRSAVGTIRPGFIPRLYRGPSGVAPNHLPARPPASVFPSDFEEPLPAGALAFAVGRHVAHYRTSHRVCTMLREPVALESVVDAALRIGLSTEAGTADQHRMMELLREHMSEENHSDLRVACESLGTSIGHVDLVTWRRAVDRSCSRAGLVLSANLGGATWILRWARGARLTPLPEAIDDLLSFWSSGAHVRVRCLLGLADG